MTRPKIVSDEEILEVIRKNKRITISELTEAVGYSVQNIYNRLHHLEKAGKIIKRPVAMALEVVEEESK